MLKLIPPLIPPDLLQALAAMGHGDDIAIVDANFPAASTAERGAARLITLAGANAAQALEAVLTLLPIDTFVDAASWTMQVVGDAAAVPPAVADFHALLAAAGERAPASLERFAFYELARGARVIVQTGEQRKYGNIILRKGVI